MGEEMHSDDPNELEKLFFYRRGVRKFHLSCSTNGELSIPTIGTASFTSPCLAIHTLLLLRKATAKPSRYSFTKRSSQSEIESTANS